MDLKPSFLRVQIPAPPLKSLNVPRETVSFSHQPIEHPKEAIWRGVLNVAVLAFGWGGGWGHFAMGGIVAIIIALCIAAGAGG